MILRAVAKAVKRVNAAKHMVPNKKAGLPSASVHKAGIALQREKSAALARL